jgi:hypothetical protein
MPAAGYGFRPGGFSVGGSEYAGYSYDWSPKTWAVATNVEINNKVRANQKKLIPMQ